MGTYYIYYMILYNDSSTFLHFLSCLNPNATLRTGEVMPRNITNGSQKGAPLKFITCSFDALNDKWHGLVRLCTYHNINRISKCCFSLSRISCSLRGHHKAVVDAAEGDDVRCDDVAGDDVRCDVGLRNIVRPTWNLSRQVLGILMFFLVFHYFSMLCYGWVLI